jgi:hypothetical protein
MDGVAAKFAVEILVYFKKSDRNAASGEEEGQHSAAGPTADDTARCLLDVDNLTLSLL